MASEEAKAILKKYERKAEGLEASYAPFDVYKDVLALFVEINEHCYPASEEMLTQKKKKAPTQCRVEPVLCND
jgi:hypothetical protein